MADNLSTLGIMKKLQEDIRDIMKENIDARDKELKIIDLQLQAQKNINNLLLVNGEEYKKTIESQIKLKELKQKLSELEQQALVQLKDTKKIEEETLENIKETNKQINEQLTVHKKITTEYEYQIKEAKMIAELIEKNNVSFLKEDLLNGKILDKLVNQNTSLKEKETIIAKIGIMLKDQTTYVELFNTGLMKANKLLMDGTKIGFFGFGEANIVGLRSVVNDVLTLPAKIFRESGNLGVLMTQAQNISLSNKQIKEWNIGLSEVANSYVSLNKSIPEFIKYDKQTQDSLAITASMAKKAGTELNTFTASITNQIKIFNKLPAEAARYSESLIAMGKRLGEGNKYIEQYNSLAPQLASYSDKQTNLYNSMAMAAKHLSMETAELLGITNKFTTFEGAADAAGKLNLVLGGQFIDTISLMRDSLEDPIKAVYRIKEGFDLAGKSIKDMSTADIRAFSSAAGVTEAQFRKMFSSGTQGLREYMAEQEKAQKREEKLADFREKALDLFEQLSGTFRSAMVDKDLIKSLTTITELVVNVAKTLAVIINGFNYLGITAKIAFAGIAAPIAKVIQYMDSMIGAALKMGNIFKSFFRLLGPVISALQAISAYSQGNTKEALIRAGSAVAQTVLATGTGGLSLAAGVGFGIGEEIVVKGAGKGGLFDEHKDDASFFVDPKGNKTVFNPNDTVSVYANNQGKTNTGVGSEELLKQIIAKLDELANRPIQMDGVTVSRQLAFANRKDAFRS